MQVLKPGPLGLVNLLQHAHHVAAISSPCPSRPESEPHSPKPDASAARAPPYCTNLLSPLASRTPKPILQRHASPGRTQLRDPGQSAGRASCSTDGPSARRQPTSRRRRREVPHVSTRTWHRGAKNELSRTPSVARAADRSLQCGGFLRRPNALLMPAGRPGSPQTPRLVAVESTIAAHIRLAAAATLACLWQTPIMRGSRS